MAPPSTSNVVDEPMDQISEFAVTFLPARRLADEGSNAGNPLHARYTAQRKPAVLARDLRGAAQRSRAREPRWMLASPRGASDTTLSRFNV